MGANYTADPNGTLDEGGRTANNTLAHNVTLLARASGQPLALAGNITFVVDGSPLTNATLRVFNTTANATLAVNDNYTYRLNDGPNLTFNEGETITLTGWWIDGFNNNHTASVSFAAYSEDNISYHDFVLGRTYGANLTDTIAPAAGDPGAVLRFTVVLNNTGNALNDTFDLSIATLLGWEAKWLRDGSEVENVTLEAGENVTLTVEVTVAAAALAGDLETVTLTATSHGDVTASDTLAIAITANQVGNVTLAPAINSSSALRDSVITYYFEITNTGNGDDNFTLAWQAGDPANWTVVNSTTWVELDLGESTTVWAKVTVPDLRSATTDTLTFTAISGYNFTLTSDRANASAAATTTVDRSYSVTVTAPAGVEGLPNSDVVYLFQVTNDGNGEDTFDLTVDQTGWNADVTPNVVLLDMGESALVTVTHTLPAAANAYHGELEMVTLTATSRGDGSRGDNTTATTAGLYRDVALAGEALPATIYPGQSIDLDLDVTNQGNGDQTVALAVSGPAAAWASLVASVDLSGYGEAAQPVLMVEIPEDRPAGSSASLTVTASVAEVSRTKTYTFTVADPSRDLDLSFPELTANTTRLNPGTSGLVDLEVENTGHVRTAYRLLLLGDVRSGGEVVEGVQVVFSNSTLTVPQGEAGTAEITVTLPVDWTGTADIIATVLVYAVVDTSVQETAVLTLRPNLPLDTSGWELEPDAASIKAGDAHTYVLTGLPAGDYDYAWEFDDDTSISNGSASESHVFATAGDHTVTITLTDDLEQTTLFTALVSVENRAPVVNAKPMVTGSDETTAEGGYIEDSTISFSLDLSGITDSDGWLILLEVDFGDGTKVAYTGAELANLMASGGELPIDHIYTNPGEYSVRVRAVDNLGEEGYSDIQTVTVKERPITLLGYSIQTVATGLGMVLFLVVTTAVVYWKGPAISQWWSEKREVWKKAAAARAVQRAEQRRLRTQRREEQRRLEVQRREEQQRLEAQRKEAKRLRWEEQQRLEIVERAEATAQLALQAMYPNGGWVVPGGLQEGEPVLVEFFGLRCKAYRAFPANEPLLDELHNRREEFAISSYFEVPASPADVLQQWALPSRLRGNVHLDAARAGIVEGILTGAPDRNFVVIGEPGVGKTVVLFEALDRLMARGPAGLLTTPAIGEAHARFGLRLFYDDIPENSALVEAIAAREVGGLVVTAREADWQALPREFQARFDRLTVPLFSEAEMRPLCEKMLAFSGVGYDAPAVAALVAYAEGSPIYVWSMIRELLHEGHRQLSQHYIQQNATKGMTNYVSLLLQRLLKERKKFRLGGLHALAALVFLADYMEERTAHSAYFHAVATRLSEPVRAALGDEMDQATFLRILGYLSGEGEVVRFPHDTWVDVLRGAGALNPFRAELQVIQREFIDTGLFESHKQQAVPEAWETISNRYRKYPTRQKDSFLALADTLLRNFNLSELKELGVDIGLIREVAARYSHLPVAAMLISKLQAAQPTRVTNVINIQDSVVYRSAIGIGGDSAGVTNVSDSIVSRSGLKVKRSRRSEFKRKE